MTTSAEMMRRDFDMSASSSRRRDTGLGQALIEISLVESAIGALEATGVDQTLFVDASFDDPSSLLQTVGEGLERLVACTDLVRREVSPGLCGLTQCVDDLAARCTGLDQFGVRRILIGDSRGSSPRRPRCRI
ncbi:MAG: hypothetical protein RLZ86_1427 [Actinomycetota bacterium]